MTTEKTHFDPSTSGLWSLPDGLIAVASDDPELIPELIEVFVTDTTERIRRICAAVPAFDFSTLRAQGHAIKGGARQIGAHAVAEASQELEAAGNSEDAALAGHRLAILRQAFDQTCRAMKDYSGSHATDART